MKITFCTLFPEFFTAFSENSIIKRAIAKGLVEINIVNIRDYSTDSYHRVDDRPTGGGAGLIMMCPQIIKAIDGNCSKKAHRILVGPRGKTFTEQEAYRLSSEAELVFICGHYEGIDARVNNYVDEELSIGDYILTGGELPSMVMADSIIRLIDGVIAKESTGEETFDNNLLEYNQYTFPYDFNGDKIPDILFSGNHEAIRKYRRKESLKLTREKRPDLFKKLQLTKEDIRLLKEIDSGLPAKWELLAIEKGKKFIK